MADETPGWVYVAWIAAGAVGFLTMRPSPHFSWDELTTTSHTELDNTPTFAASLRLIALAWTVLEPLRSVFGPIVITSGYRSAEVNDAAGGASASYHLTGDGVDFYAPGHSAQTVMRWLYENRSRLPLGEVVIYPSEGRLHVSRDPSVATDAIEWYTSDGSGYTSWSP